MQGDFITRIKSAYNQFTKAEKKVADFVLANPKKVLSLSISEGQEEMNQFTGNDLSGDDSFGEMAKKVLNTNINALMETYSLIKEDEFDKVIRMLHQARRIYFFGVGASMLTAMKAMNKFMRIENKVFCIQDSHMQAMAAATMSQEDVAVIFSYSGATKDTIHGLQAGRRPGGLCHPLYQVAIKRLCGHYPAFRS